MSKQMHIEYDLHFVQIGCSFPSVLAERNQGKNVRFGQTHSNQAVHLMHMVLCRTRVHPMAQGNILTRMPQNASFTMLKCICLHISPDHLFENRAFCRLPCLSAVPKYRPFFFAASDSACPCNAHEMPARACCQTHTCPPFCRPVGCLPVVNSYLASQSPKKTAKNCTSVQTADPALDNLRPEGYIIKCIQSDPY